MIEWELIKIDPSGLVTPLYSGEFSKILQARDMANRYGTLKTFKRLAKIRRNHKLHSQFCAYGMRIKLV